MLIFNYSIHVLGLEHCKLLYTAVSKRVSYKSIKSILVPRAYDPFGLWLGSRALAGPDILSMRRVFVSHCQPIRFAGFDGKSLDQTRALDPNHRPKGS